MSKILLPVENLCCHLVGFGLSGDIGKLQGRPCSVSNSESMADRPKGKVLVNAIHKMLQHYCLMIKIIFRSYGGVDS